MDTLLGIPIPFTWPERLGCLSALVTIVFGLMCYFIPRRSLRILRLQTFPDVPEAISEMRGTLAGFYLGVGGLVILFQQPMLYMALAAGWGFTAFGRLSSMILDRGMTPFNYLSIVIEASLALAPAWAAYSMLF